MPRISSLFVVTRFPIVVESHFFNLPYKHSSELEIALVQIGSYNMADTYIDMITQQGKLYLSSRITLKT